MEYTKLELDASKKGWRCAECGLLIDAIGRPIFGNETWTFETKSISWIENKPEWNYCPKCGKPIKEGDHT